MADAVKRSLAYAALITAMVATVLWLFLYGLWSPAAWPTPERPPKQGEAADVVRLPSGAAVHSPSALHRVVREPQNTWSNLGYVLVGALLAGRFPGRLLRGLALALIGVGVGSFLYHASASSALRAVDVGAMYWLYGHCALLAAASLWARFGAWCERWAVTLTTGLLIGSAAVTFHRQEQIWGVRPFEITLVTTEVVILFAVAILANVIRVRRWSALGWPSVSAILFAAAAAFQVGDRPDGWCWNPRGTVQGHALWHLLSAAAIGIAVWSLADSRPAPCERKKAS